ncbi:MAG: DUF3419 family protein [Tissierellia bacterium]|nr:DUF3419 family protein [Tissierellia bacterium]
MKNNRFSFIRYSNCWEDSKILLEALKIRDGEIGLSVASGGDNTFSMLLDNPSKIYAFDINETQLYCTELKIKAMQNLEYEELLKFLGVIKSKNRLEVLQKLSIHLSKESYQYFLNNKKIIERGVIHSGKFENYFQLFRKFVMPLFCNSKKMDIFSKMSNTEEQKKFYEKYINNRRYKFIFKIYFGVKVMGKLGRDKSFYEHVDQKNRSASDIKRRFEFGISNISNFENPYLRYILKGNYEGNALPHYLKRENYEIIKDRLDRIILLKGSFLEIDHRVEFDFLNLSDIFEYISEEEFKYNIDKLETVTKNGSRIAYWNMQNRRYLPDKSFVNKSELSRELYTKNKSFFYRDFCIYEK